jgi:predicted ArsR family transcriptional regulator
MLNAEPSPVNSRIQSIDRAVELLEAIAAAGEPVTAPVLADRCGLNRSTAWRMLATLEHHGLVERDPATNRCGGSPRRPGRRSTWRSPAGWSWSTPTRSRRRT